MVAVVWGIRFWLGYPDWIAYILTVIALFTPVGDAINVLVCRRALRRLDRST